MKKCIFGKIALLILFSVFLSACGLSNEEENTITLTPETTSTDYEMAQVNRGDVILTKKIYCTYKEENGEELSFGVDGRRVEQVLVSVGDEVKKGDLLASLKCEDLEEEKASYEYTLSINRQRKENAFETYNFDCKELKKLYDEHKLVQAVYDEQYEKLTRSVNREVQSYEDAITVASLKLSEVNEKIGECQIYAGMDGIISYVSTSITNGENSYKADNTVIRLIDKSHCVFELPMSDAKDYLEYFTPGAEIMLSNSGKARVNTVVTEYSEEDESILLDLLDMNEEIKIGTRLFINLELDEAKNVLYLPTASVHKNGDNYYVFVADEGGLKSIKYVSVGLVGDSFTEIKEGLSEGDIVIKK